MQENFTKRRIQRKARKPKPGSAWLNRTLSANILQKAKLLYRINQQLKKTLPAPINQHCWLMDWTKEELTFGVDAAEWLMHIRAREPDLKIYVTQQIKIPFIIKVRYLVRPKMNTILANQSTSKRIASKISIKNRSLLQTIANTISDEKLKVAMLRLADD